MQVIKIKRTTKNEKRFTEKMGMLYTKVTRIHLAFCGIKYKTLHRYRMTYYGQVKSCEDCEVAL